jgi:hypothetical protein
MGRTLLRVGLVPLVFAAVIFNGSAAGLHTQTEIAYAQQAAPDIFAFYQTALAAAAATYAHERDLSIACQKPVADTIFAKDGDMVVTFLAGSTKKIVLAAFTKHPLERPSTVQLRRIQEGIEWMFVFDRNRDGKIDYILWPVGVSPILEGPPPPGFPVRSGMTSTMSHDQGVLLQRYARMSFWHWADENFDGKVSAIVLEAWDPGGLFAITGWQVIRSSHFDGVLDQCWYFTRDINSKTGECESSGPGYTTRRIDSAGIAPDDLTTTSVWFSWLNEAAASCGLTGDSF